jgi:hypothetical protein
MISVMKHRIAKLLSLLMLLSLAAQPLLVQARAMAPPCQMQMMQQMAQQGMTMHSDGVCHSDGQCADCDLCGHSGGSALLHLSLFDNAVHGTTTVADTYRVVFISIALPVDSPPPRSL